jgi:hypothetical protein
MKKEQRLFVLSIAWLIVVSLGLMKLWAYSNTPGPAATGGITWPNETSIPRDPEHSTLVVFAHPQCPCSDASIEELARLMAHVQGRVTVRVVFYRPAHAEAGWERTSLWNRAEAIPGVTVSADDDGRQAALFGAMVSGQTMLYDASGTLAFEGGLTYARGHAGDNAGSTAIASLLLKGQALTHHSPVFGCFLRESPAAQS